MGRGRKKGYSPDKNPHFVMCYGDTSGVFLYGGKEVLVDTSDLPLLFDRRWVNIGLYAQSCRNGRRTLLHRLILNAPAGMTVDHINGNGFDNRRCNLRLATKQQNLWNQKMNKKVGYKGVVRSGSKWVARISAHGTPFHLGTFKTPEAAAQAYNEAAVKHFGEFARLNPIPAATR